MKPDILLLDEPTNHLDLNAVIWLNNYLTTYNKTIIVASHNIGFIDNISNVIWYINNKVLNVIHGKYYKYTEFIEQEFKENEKKYETYDKKKNELVNRKKPKPSTKTEVDEFIKKNHVDKPYKTNITIKFNNITHINSKNVIEFKSVSFKYDDKIIFNNINFGIGLDSRFVLLGENGIGKTTLFKLCMNALKETDGFIHRDERIKISYYHQNVIDNLPLNISPIEHLMEHFNIDMEKCRKYLGQIGLRDKNICNLQIKNLSGGQKARVGLCKIQLENPHIILMDEPTNHMDINSIEELITGINGFNGSVIIITHDTYLIEKIKNAQLYHINNGNIAQFKDTFEKYCELIYDK